MLQTAEPGSRRPHRQRGAPQRPPHRPLGPRGPETLAARTMGPDTRGAWSSSPGNTREHPNRQRLSAVVKYTPWFPSSACPLPEAAEQDHREREAPRQVEDSGCGGPPTPAGPPPRVTCEDPDTDLMVVVREDHSLGRHVSQRSHRTDRSREKPEPGARAGRERACLGERERGARGEREGGGRAPGGLRGGEGGGDRRGRARSARVRGGGGVGPRDPESGGEGASLGWEKRWPRGESARRRRGKAGESPEALRSETRDAWMARD
ncbi:hypothetical protein NN561_000263 [Cricetulus griseus]